MYYSKNNIIVKIKNSSPEQYAILNPLTGSFDLVEKEEYEQIDQIRRSGDTGKYNKGFINYLLERGYLYENKTAEDKIVIQEFANFRKEKENSEVQLLLIPTYGCNLACTYCYEHGISEKDGLIKEEVVDAFFDYANTSFTDRKAKPFITLFGGEPLVNSPAQRKIIEYIIDKCIQYDYEIAAVTNGFDLTNFIDILKKVKIKEIQVTLDGSREIHNQRRGTTNGKGTFDRVITGMELLVENKIPINLRAVVDRENMLDLVNLAHFLDEKGWLDLGQDLFKTQLGRNYELFECYAKPQHLMTQAELWAEYSKLSNEYPVLKKFHRPDFKGIRHLVDTGDLIMASFDTCPAAKTEWVFDYKGDIYGCTASCGREDLKLGTFYPEVSLDKKPISEWQKRNVLTINECRDCRYNVVCGGGCGVVALNRNGSILSPDCRPIQDIFDIGINHYIDDIKDLAGDEEEFTSGCTVCGEELVYSTRQPVKAKCHYCGKEYETYVVCRNNHYVCDECHGKNVLELVEEICTATDIKDPIELANIIFEIPGLNMHGPEYHSIVPAILVTAYQNNTEKKDPAGIKEAIKRGRDTKGGYCGTHGACGAAIGAGAAYSIINEASPMSKESRGNANLITAHALLDISKLGGPRCCKRETILSLKSAKLKIDVFKAANEAEYICKQFKDNKDCIGNKCPYFPIKVTNDRKDENQSE